MATQATVGNDVVLTEKRFLQLWNESLAPAFEEKLNQGWDKKLDKRFDDFEKKLEKKLEEKMKHFWSQVFFPAIQGTFLTKEEFKQQMEHLATKEDFQKLEERFDNQLEYTHSRFQALSKQLNILEESYYKHRETYKFSTEAHANQIRKLTGSVFGTLADKKAEPYRTGKPYFDPLNP